MDPHPAYVFSLNCGVAFLLLIGAVNTGALFHLFLIPETSKNLQPCIYPLIRKVRNLIWLNVAVALTGASAMTLHWWLWL